MFKTTYNFFDPEGLKVLTQLRVGLSHLNAHIFYHNFPECLNPLCPCSIETEDSTYCLLHCRYSSNQRPDLMNSVNSVIQNFEFMSENNKKDLLLFGDSRFDENNLEKILWLHLEVFNCEFSVADLTISGLMFNSASDISICGVI